MARQITAIKDITPHTKKPWTARIVVLEKGYARDPVSSPTKYQRLILADAQGTRVQAIIFGKDIELLRNTLLLLKHYYISNAIVRHIDPKHRVVQNDYQWSINARVIIEEASPEETSKAMVSFKFKEFSKLENYKDSMAQVDVLGIVLQMLPARQQQTRSGPLIIQEMIIINEELQPIILTMWNQFIDNEANAIAQIIDTKPIVAAMRLKVVSFNGLSLSTRSSSSLLINPDIPEVIKLQNWLSNNLEEIEKIMKTNFVQNLIHLEEIQANKEIIQISSLSDLPDNRLFWLKCSVRVINLDQPLWYMCCNNCHRSTTATFKQVFNCNYCKRTDNHGIPRCRIDIEATDSTGVIEGTLFGEVAEKVIQCEALKLMQISEEQIEHKIEDLITTVHNKEMMLHLKAYTSDFHGETKRKFNINEVLDAPDTPEASQQKKDQPQPPTLTNDEDLNTPAQLSDVSHEERNLTQEAPPSSQDKTIL